MLELYTLKRKSEPPYLAWYGGYVALDAKTFPGYSASRSEMSQNRDRRRSYWTCP